MVVVFSDVDGTIADYASGSHENARKGLALLRKKEVPLVLASSKTMPEIEALDMLTDPRVPFIFENGGGIAWKGARMNDVELSGPGLDHLENLFRSLREISSIPMKSIFDFQDEELADTLKVGLEQARLSKMRRATLPFVFKGMPCGNELDEMRDYVLRHDALLTEGVHFHYLSHKEADKGTAAAKVIKWYERSRAEGIYSIGIGDGLNDVPLFEAVDCPVLVRRGKETPGDAMCAFVYITAEKESAGFSEAVEFLISKGYL